MQATHLSRAGMLDRVHECDTLDQLVAGVRAGESRALALGRIVAEARRLHAHR